PMIKIGIAEKINQVYVKTGDAYSLSNSDGVQLLKGMPLELLSFISTADGITVSDRQGRIILTSSRPLVLRYESPAAATAVFDLEDGSGYFFAGNETRMYRGYLHVVPYIEGITLINELNLEEYLYSAVPSEMPSAWPEEALKAQAVAARTYTFANLGRYASRGFDLYGSITSASYKGAGNEAIRTRKAVDSTRGQILTVNGKPINAVYSANSGGYTESSESVWGFASSLKGIPDSPDTERSSSLAPYELAGWILSEPESYSGDLRFASRSAYRWSLWVSREELETRLGMGDKLGRILSITTRGRGVSGRVNAVLIRGSRGDYAVKGDKIRSVLGGLKSNLFMVVPKIGQEGLPEFFIFAGAGWGHGVGMSQSGAAGMAAAGFAYTEILKRYYPGTELNTLY
ncbi:MAG: SpoIID/LytB domain-containing protein, partial [Spirochaetota bacterium]